VAKDEHVVPEDVDEVRGDQGEGDGTDEVHALEGAAEGEIEEQREESEGQRVHVGASEDGDVWRDAEEMEEAGEQADGNQEERQEQEAEVDAVDEGVVAVVAPAGAEGLGDERVQADQEALAEENEDEKKAGSDADGGDGLGTVGEAANHHGVHDGHGNPADFGEDEGEGQMESGPQLGA